MRKFFLVLAVILVVVASSVSGFAEDRAASGARVVVLGTGNPSADPGRWRRAAAAEKNGVAALRAKELKIVFITHLHSDHTLGYPDLIFSPWVLGGTEALEAYGPHGLKNMTSHIEKAWEEDVRVRRQGLEEANATG